MVESGGTKRYVDVSTMSLEETVRTSVEQWPDSLVVTAVGLKSDTLSVESLAKVGFSEGLSACAFHCSLDMLPDFVQISHED